MGSSLVGLSTSRQIERQPTQGWHVFRHIPDPNATVALAKKPHPAFKGMGFLQITGHIIFELSIIIALSDRILYKRALGENLKFSS